MAIPKKKTIAPKTCWLILKVRLSSGTLMVLVLSRDAFLENDTDNDRTRSMKDLVILALRICRMICGKSAADGGNSSKKKVRSSAVPSGAFSRISSTLLSIFSSVFSFRAGACKNRAVARFLMEVGTVSAQVYALW